MSPIKPSLYKFKIIEHEWQDWDSLYFTLNFSKDVSDIEKTSIETSIDHWFVHNQDKNDGGFHYLDTFKWSDKKTLIFYIDFGSAEFDELTSLLNLLKQ